MSARLDFMLILSIAFVAIDIVLIFESSLLLTITVLAGMFTLELMIIYKRELFGKKKQNGN